MTVCCDCVLCLWSACFVADWRTFARFAVSKIGPLSRPNRGPLQDIDAYLEAAGRGAHDVLKHSRGCALVEYRYAVCCDRAVTVL